MESTRERVRIRTTDLGDMVGAWDPDTRTIWLHQDLTAAERRSTFAHELIHALRGDEKCRDHVLDARQELRVERLAARLLISAARLADALAWCSSDHELAEELRVDVDTVIARRSCLTAAEIALIEARIALIEHVA